MRTIQSTTLRRTLTLATALLVAPVFFAPAGAEPASPVASSATDVPIDPELLAVREAAWRHWFAGDEAALRAMLPPEFIGLDMGDGPFRSLDDTLGASRDFRAKGGRLVRLEFPETRAQRFGDVVVLYGRFAITLESEGAEQTLAGRLTEVFVRRDGRWWHPGWHLDLVSTP